MQDELEVRTMCIDQYLRVFTLCDSRSEHIEALELLPVLVSAVVALQIVVVVRCLYGQLIKDDDFGFLGLNRMTTRAQASCHLGEATCCTR